MPSRISEPGFEMAGKTGTAQVRAISQEEHAAAASPRMPRWNGSCATMALFIAFAPVAQPHYACACHRRAWRATAIPQVQMARDILLFTQKRDPLGRPTAYPIKAASLPGRAVR